MNKILMVGNDPSVKGGITTVISQFRNYNWKNEDIDLKFIPTYIDKNNIIKIAFFFLAIVRFIFNIFFIKPNYVHIHMSYKGSFTRTYILHVICKLFNVKDIIHLHGSEFEKWYNESCNTEKKLKVRKLLKECCFMIVLGKKWEKKIKKIQPETNIIVVNNAINIPDKVSYSYNDSFNILFLGVLIKRKGVYDLLNAISILNKKNVLNNVRFVIAGDGDERKKLESKSIELNIDKYIKFYGWINSEEKKALLESSQLLVLPSYNEGLPMAILEGISFGLPIIATNVGDISEAVIDGENGFLLEPGDVNKLAEYLERFITLNNQQLNLFRESSRKLAYDKFSDKKYFEVFSRIYKGEI